jgi:DNA-binding NarL/FixJ family response regulator
MSSLLNNDVKETCMKAGANSFIDKKASIPHIMQSLNALLTATSHAVNESSPVLKLSKRQRQIVMMLDIGMSNKSIANELNISQKTVNVHLWHLFRRIGVSSRTQAIRFARTNALL